MASNSAHQHKSIQIRWDQLEHFHGVISISSVENLDEINWSFFMAEISKELNISNHFHRT